MNLDCVFFNFGSVKRLNACFIRMYHVLSTAWAEVLFLIHNALAFVLKCFLTFHDEFCELADFHLAMVNIFMSKRKIFFKWSFVCIAVVIFLNLNFRWSSFFFWEEEGVYTNRGRNLKIQFILVVLYKGKTNGIRYKKQFWSVPFITNFIPVKGL